MGGQKRRRAGGNPRKGRGWEVNKHTPGPWIARNLSKGIWAVEAASPHVPGKTQEVCRIAGPWNPENYRRNARLIAAAPELLNMLQRMLDESSSGSVCLCTMEHAENALKKARGEA